MTAVAPVRRGVAMSLAWVALPLLAAAYQFAAAMVARTGAQAAGWNGWFGAIVGTPWFALLLASEIASFAVWTMVLSRMSLARAFPISAIGYVAVMAMAALVLHQWPGGMAVAGGVAILAGAALLAFGAA